jgi:hypothetical protein
MGNPTMIPAQQPLGYTQDPRSAYLAQAIQSMSQKPQGSYAGVGESLLAQALMQRGQQGGQAGGGMPGDGTQPPDLTASDAGGGQGVSPGLIGLGQQALAQATGQPSTPGLLDPATRQQQGGNWLQSLFGGGGPTSMAGLGG